MPAALASRRALDAEGPVGIAIALIRRAFHLRAADEQVLLAAVEVALPDLDPARGVPAVLLVQVSISARTWITPGAGMTPRLSIDSGPPPHPG